MNDKVCTLDILDTAGQVIASFWVLFVFASYAKQWCPQDEYRTLREEYMVEGRVSPNHPDATLSTHILIAVVLRDLSLYTALSTRIPLIRWTSSSVRSIKLAQRPVLR